MSEHDKSGRNNGSLKGQGKRIGASVLLAAASLLGTSLGISAAAPDQPLTPIAKDAGQKRMLLAEYLKSAAGPAGQLQSNQDKHRSHKSIQSNHIKMTPSSSHKLNPQPLPPG
jgi:hypothetical protein